VPYNGLRMRVASPDEWDWLQLAIAIDGHHESVRDFRFSAERYPEQTDSQSESHSGHISTFQEECST
jgi:hypothetical protein